MMKAFETFAERGLMRLRSYKIPKRHDLALRDFMRRLAPVQSETPLIRIGDGGDGGYLVPDDLDGIGACFSPGVAETAAFEAAMLARGVPCFLADHSVEAPPFADPLIDFEKKFIGLRNDAVHMRLGDWTEAKAARIAGDLVLQMDIEGAEYEVLLDASDALLRRFRIIVVEFHHLDWLLHPAGFRLLDAAFAKLQRSFALVHIHPNNCTAPVRYKDFALPPVMEFTFHRSDRLRGARPATTFPHALDRPNLTHLPDFALPKCWYGEGSEEGAGRNG